jgi:hypothetical protein
MLSELLSLLFARTYKGLGLLPGLFHSFIIQMQGMCMLLFRHLCDISALPETITKTRLGIAVF